MLSQRRRLAIKIERTLTGSQRTEGERPGKNKHGRWAPAPGWGSALLGESAIAATGWWRRSLGCSGRSWSTVIRKARNSPVGHEKLVILLSCRNEDGSLEWLLSSRLFWICVLPRALQKSNYSRAFSWNKLWTQCQCLRSSVVAMWGLREAKLYTSCHQQSRLRETPLGATWCWLAHDVSSLPTLLLGRQNFIICNYTFLLVYSPLLCSLVSLFFFPLRKKIPKFEYSPTWLFFFQILGQIWQEITLKWLLNFFELIFQIKQESRPWNSSKSKISVLVKTVCLWGKHHWFGWREQKVGGIYKVSEGTCGKRPWALPGTETRHSNPPGPSICVLFMMLAKCLIFPLFSGGRMSLTVLAFVCLLVYLLLYLIT